MIEFIVMALAAYRLTRVVTLDTFPPWRDRLDRFTVWIENHHGPDWSDGLTCPWCVGFYVSIAVVAVTAQLTNVPLPVLQALAVMTVVGVIGSKLED